MGSTPRYKVSWGRLFLYFKLSWGTLIVWKNPFMIWLFLQIQPYLKGECYLMDYDTINLLGLQPDDIQDINIVRSRDIININVTLTKKIKSCPCCSSLNANVKTYKSKKITHSIFNTNKTVINYRCRRFICKDCHKT